MNPPTLSAMATALHTGTLAADQIRVLVAQRRVDSQAGIADAQIQPASLDLTISDTAYRMPGSLLPRSDEQLQDLIDDLALERCDLATPTCLARGQTYLIPLREHCHLPEGIEAYTNSKSSTGRVDLATRVLCNGNPRYDRVPAGYHGGLWIEVIPRSFDCVLQAGDSLNQAIFFHDRQLLSHRELRSRHAADGLLFDPAGQPVPAAACIHDDHLVMTADLGAEIVGFQAKRTHRPLRLQGIAAHHADDYFVPVRRPTSGMLYLQKDCFYILATWERVRVPLDLACEMVPYDAAAGEFRAHYAGFFDPGWGTLAHGTCAVLEVRPHDDLILRHQQPICAMRYEQLQQPCSEPYGRYGNNYATQTGPRLSKHFRG
jgi:dCTP deaminase